MQASQLRHSLEKHPWLFPVLLTQSDVPSTTLKRNELDALASWAERSVLYLAFDDWTSRLGETIESSEQSLISDMSFGQLWGVRTTELRVWYRTSSDDSFSKCRSPDGLYTYPLGFTDIRGYTGRSLRDVMSELYESGLIHFDAVMVTNVVGVKLVPKSRSEAIRSMCQQRRYHICEAVPTGSPKYM